MASRLTSPAFPRNHEPICEVVVDVLAGADRVLELACGPGQHACAYAARMPDTRFFPTDGDARVAESVNAWAAELGVCNVAPFAKLDVTDGADWEAALAHGPFAGAVAVNVMHMVGLATVSSLLEGCGRALAPGGRLVVYDCFTFDGKHVSDSNARFHERLRAATPAGGVHAIEAVTALARDAGLSGPEVRWLPANNQCAIWTKTS